MIYVIDEQSLVKSRYDDKPPMPADVNPEHSVPRLPHLPRVGEIIQIHSENLYPGKVVPQYREVTGILHDIRDEDVDIYLIVRRYEP